MLDPVALEDKVFRDSILIDMNNDPIKKCVEDDSLIMEFGRRMLQKHREPHKKAYVANKCRELGRLLLDGKQKHGWKKLEDAVDPKHFEKLIQSVQVVAGFDQTTARFESPSTALKLGYSLTNCCAIVKCRALRESDKALKDKCSNFQELYANEWHDRISSQAHRTLHTRMFNNPKRLPFVEDVVKLHHHLSACAEEAKSLIKTDAVKGYSELAQVCLSQVSLFNRRRSGEAQRLKVSEINCALKEDARGRDEDEQILNSLSKFEKLLYRTHFRIETTGKRGRRVPILLTEEMKKNMDVLLHHRNAAGVESDFVFTKVGSKNPIRGCDCLKLYAESAGLKQPELMTSTKLRQQLGTHCQVLGLAENTQDILATFMGHDIRVHRNFYRLPENVLQVAKVCKVLHAINSGNLSKFNRVIIHVNQDAISKNLCTF